MPKDLRKTVAIRLPESLIQALDSRAEEMSCPKTDIIEKALRCFLGIKPEQECLTNKDIWTAVEDLRQRIESVEDLRQRIERLERV